MISIRRHNGIEKCWGRREAITRIQWSVSETGEVGVEKEASEGRKKKRKTAKGCRKRVDGGGKKKRGKRRVGVRDRGSNAATVEWMAYRWRTRPPNSIRGGGKIVFRCFPRTDRDVSLAGPRSAWFRCTCYLFRLLDRVPRIRFSIHLSTPVVCRTSGMR